MSLTPAIVLDPPRLRWFRLFVPFALVAVLTALVVTPGMVAGDRPHAVSFCPEHEVERCAELLQALAIGVRPAAD